METVLMEASTGHQQKNGHVPVHSANTNGTSEKQSGDLVKGALEASNAATKNEMAFNMVPSNSPIDMRFEKITYTATEGSLLKGKS